MVSDVDEAARRRGIRLRIAKLLKEGVHVVGYGGTTCIGILVFGVIEQVACLICLAGEI